MAKVFHFNGYPLYIDIKLVSIIACQKASEAASAVIVVNLQLMLLIRINTI